MNKSAPKILVIDNYDSFVYNLVQYLGELGAKPIVVRNDEVTIQQALELKPVLLSPGPGRPQDAGILCEAVRAFAEITPIFGVCLGHQAIGHVYGANIISAPELQHGKTSQIHHKNLGVFAGLDSPVTATRYHSLTIDPESVPTELIITATTDDGLIMGVRHKDLDVEGVQFHPESILTDHGHEIIKTFLLRCEK
jgi:anthranilate synthase/aminodeoxychorismate synthase-like glutamine amidotransferase